MYTIRMLWLFIRGEIRRLIKSHEESVMFFQAFWFVLSFIQICLTILFTFLGERFVTTIGRMYLFSHLFFTVPFIIWAIWKYIVPYFRDRYIEWGYFYATGGKAKSEADQIMYESDYFKDDDQTSEDDESPHIPEWLKR